MAQLFGGDIADTDPSDLSFVTERDHLRELAVEINARFVGAVDEAQVHCAELLDVETAQIGFDTFTKLSGRCA